MNTWFKKMKSPVGELTLIATEKGLAAILWENDKITRVKARAGIEKKNHPVLIECETQLKEYFKGERNEFSLPLDLIGTDFQKAVWKRLRRISYGKTKSYGQIAVEIGNPKAVRAVGSANGKNPLSIIVPCHRVIGANGKLTGFAGGLPVKAFLLNLETTSF